MSSFKDWYHFQWFSENMWIRPKESLNDIQSIPNTLDGANFSHMFGLLNDLIPLVHFLTWSAANGFEPRSEKEHCKVVKQTTLDYMSVVITSSGRTEVKRRASSTLPVGK